MDLSAVIFVVLALAWAGYLIPKALRQHDDAASDRLDEGHTDRVRVLKRKQEPKEREVAVEVPEPAAVPAPSVATRTSTRRAAQRRRRVLAVLLFAVAAVAGLAAASYVPWWSTAVPGGLIVVFLVTARLSVRRAQRSSLARRRTAPEAHIETYADEPVAHVSQAEVEVPVARPTRPEAELAREEAALTDDGSLWDPLPMTLPTYVNKARARRTVRTIELTGMQSSGHSEADSALAREAEEQQAATEATTENRKVAGA